AAANRNAVKASATELENEYLRVKIDPHSGCITSLFDKRSGSEALAPAETDTGGPRDSICGNLLQAFYDKPKEWDAWNIDSDFEMPALQWADISDANHGFSLLNDSKYGYDAKGNVLRLSLLRSPEWPDPHADEGQHEFTYSLYPHGGNWKDAQTVRRGYELNYKLLSLQLDNHV